MAKGALRCIAITFLIAAAAIPAAAVTDVIPCVVGNKWEYDSVKLLRASILYQGQPISGMRDASSGSSVYQVLSVDDAKSSPVVYNYRETTRMLSVNADQPDVDTTDLRITNDNGKLRILTTDHRSSQDDKPEKQVYDPPLLYFIRGAASGKPWNVGEMRDGDTKSFTTAHSAGKETITVPGGTFKDCLKVVYSSDELSGTMGSLGQDVQCDRRQKPGHILDCRRCRRG